MSCLSLKFGANISTLFKENDMLDRLRESRLSGFTCFEAQNLYDLDIEKLSKTKNYYELDMSLTNSPPEINDTKHDKQEYFGYACIPGKQAAFLKSMQQAIEFARAMNCKKIHILAGLKYENNNNLVRKTYVENLKVAADLLQKENILGLIEPLCPEVKPNYFLDSFTFAVDILEEVGSSNLKLMLDIFHLQMLHGDAVCLIDKFYPYAGHIQVSQAPDRSEPSTRGLIDYQKIFSYLADKNYSDFIGLEYFPKKSTKESLAFLRPTGNFTVKLDNFDSRIK